MADTPVPSMSIPMPLADALLACYYGTGPRHRTSPLHATDRPQWEGTVPGSQPKPPDDPEADARLRKALDAVRNRRMIPRGAAPGSIDKQPPAPPTGTPTLFPENPP